jgi:hypothetical protein
VAPALDRAVADWSTVALERGELATLSHLADLSPLGWLSTAGFMLCGLALAGGLALWARLRPDVTSSSVTWGCGYLAPSPRMQYTSTSFSEVLVALFRWVVRPRVESPTIGELFPQSAAYRSEAPDSVLDGLTLPILRWIGGRVIFFRVFQQGSLQAYLFYILAILMVLLVWPYLAAPWNWSY